MSPRRKNVAIENPDLFDPQFPALTTFATTPQGRPREATPRRKGPRSGSLECARPRKALPEKAANELAQDIGKGNTPTLGRTLNDQFFEGLEINFGSMNRADANSAWQRLLQPCRVVVKDMFRQTFTNVPLHRILNEEEPAPSCALSREGNLSRNSPFMETTRSGGQLGRRRSMNLEVGANVDNEKELGTNLSTGTSTTALEPGRQEKNEPSLEELMLECLEMLKKCPAEGIGNAVLVKRAKRKKKHVASDAVDVAMNELSPLSETYAHESQCSVAKLACEVLATETQPMLPSIPTTVAPSKEAGVAARLKRKRVTRQSVDVAVKELSSLAETYDRESQCFNADLACDVQRASAKHTPTKLSSEHEKLATETQSMVPSLPRTVAPSAKPKGKRKKAEKPQKTETCEDVIRELIPDWCEAATASKVAARSRQPRRQPGPLTACSPAPSDDQTAPESTEGKHPKKKRRNKAKADHLLDDRPEEKGSQQLAILQLLEQISDEIEVGKAPEPALHPSVPSCPCPGLENKGAVFKDKKNTRRKSNRQTDKPFVEVVPNPPSMSAEPPSDADLPGPSSKRSKRSRKRHEPPFLDALEGHIESEPRLGNMGTTQAPPLPRRRKRLYSEDLKSEPEAKLGKPIPPPPEPEPNNLVPVSQAKSKHAKRDHRKKYMKIKKVKPSAAEDSGERRPPAREAAGKPICAVETPALSQVTPSDGRKCPAFPAEEHRARKDPFLFQDTEELLYEFTDGGSEATMARKGEFQPTSVEEGTTSIINPELPPQPFLAIRSYEDPVEKYQLKELSICLGPLTQVQIDQCSKTRPGGCSPIKPATPLQEEQHGAETEKPTVTETRAASEQVSGKNTRSSPERASGRMSHKSHKPDKRRKRRRRESHASSDPQQESFQNHTQSSKARKEPPPRAKEGPEQPDQPKIRAQKLARADQSRVVASGPSVSTLKTLETQAVVDGIVNRSSESIPWRKFTIPKKSSIKPEKAALNQIKELCLPEKTILDRLIPILGKTQDGEREAGREESVEAVLRARILSTPSVAPPPPPGRGESDQVLTDSQPTCNSSSTSLEEREPSERSGQSATDSDRQTAAPVSMITAVALPNSAESQRLLSPTVSSYKSSPPRRNVSARFTRSWAKNDSDESDEDNESDLTNEDRPGEEDLPETFSEQVQCSEVAAGSEGAKGQADKASDSKQEDTDVLELHVEDCDLLEYGMEELVSEATSPNRESEEGTPAASTTNSPKSRRENGQLSAEGAIEAKTSELAPQKDRSTIPESTAKPQDVSSRSPRESKPTRSGESSPASTCSRSVDCPLSSVARPTASRPVLIKRKKPSGALPNDPQSPSLRCPIPQSPFSNAEVEANQPAPTMKPLKQAGICIEELRNPGSCQRQNCIQHFGLNSPGLGDCILREISFWMESDDRDKFFHSEELILDGAFGLPQERLQVPDVVEYRHELIRIFGRRLLAERGLEALLHFFGPTFNTVVYQARFFNDILGSPSFWPLLRKDFDHFVLHFCRSEMVLNSASSGAVVSMATTHAKSMLRHCILKAMKSVSGFQPPPCSLAVLITQAKNDRTQLIETARLVRTVDSRTLMELNRNTLLNFCRCLEQQGTSLPADLGENLAFFRAIAVNQNHPAASTSAAVSSPSGPKACATVRPQAYRDPTLKLASNVPLRVTDIPRTHHQQHPPLVAPPHNYAHFSPDRYLHNEQIRHAADRPVAVDPFFTLSVRAHSPPNDVARAASTPTPRVVCQVLLPAPAADRQAPLRLATLPPPLLAPLPRTTTPTPVAPAVPKYIPTPKSQLPPPSKFDFPEEEHWDSLTAVSPHTEPNTSIPPALPPAPRAPSEAQQIASWIAQRHFEPLAQLLREVPHNRLDQLGHSIFLHYEERIRQRAPDVARDFVALVDYLIPNGGPSAAGADCKLTRELATVALTIFARFADNGIELVDQAEILLKTCCQERLWPATVINCSLVPFGTYNAFSMEMLNADCWLHGGGILEAAEVLKEFWEFGLGPEMAEHDNDRESETLVRLLYCLIEAGPKMKKTHCEQSWSLLFLTFDARIVIPLKLKEELPNLMDMAFATKHQETSLGIRGIWSKLKTKIGQEMEDALSVSEMLSSDEESDRK